MPHLPPMWDLARLLRCLFFSLPPIKVSSDKLAFATKRPKRTVAHSLADAVGKEPRGFHGALKLWRT
jgi:hypothetical protein